MLTVIEYSITVDSKEYIQGYNDAFANNSSIYTQIKDLTGNRELNRYIIGYETGLLEHNKIIQKQENNNKVTYAKSLLDN
jgi:hypothetical protein